MTRRAFKIKVSITNRSENMQRYFNELNHNIDSTPIDKSQERQLIRKAQSGCTKSRDKLVHANLRFVVSYAKSFYRGNVAFQLEDLIQEANIGLLNAIKLYDLDKYNYKLFSYGVYWMLQAITNSLDKNMNVIRIPSNGVKDSHKISKGRDLFLSVNEREASDSELHELTGCSPDKVVNLGRVSYTASLDKPLSDEIGAGTTIDRVAVEDRSFESFDSLYNCLLPYVDKLKERQKYVLKAVFGFGRDKVTIHSCAQELGLTRERTRQLKNIAIKNLRAIVGENNSELMSFL